VTIVRIVLADPRTGRPPDGGAVNGKQLIVLADDAGHRAVPLWLRVIDAKLLWGLLQRSVGDAVMAGVLEETAARLLHAAGVGVTAVDNHLAATRDDQLMAEQDLHEAAAPMGGLYRTDSTGSPNSPVTTDHRIAIFVPEPVFGCRRHGRGYFTELRNRFARIYPRWSGRRKSRPRLTALSARLPEEGDVVSRWFLGRPERRLQALGLAILRRACSISPGERDVAASALWVDHKSYLTWKFREMAVLV